MNDKITLAASIVDLGAIKWTTNSKRFYSQGSYTYEGYDVGEALVGDSDSLDFDAALDTLANRLGFQSESKSYSTSLPTKIYLSGQYEIMKNGRLNGGIIQNNVSNESLTTNCSGICFSNLPPGPSPIRPPIQPYSAL